MGHMDDDNEDHYTITLRWRHGDTTPEQFHRCTNVEQDGDGITFDDAQGKHHEYHGVSFHVAQE